jgi:heme/copper-type cytochrome/quinol oxidase subunit 2
MSAWRSRTALIVIAVTAVVLLLGAPAFGQCSMCRAALAGSNNAFFIRNFNIGVLVLLVPPVTIFCSIFVVLKRYKTTDDERETEANSTCSSPEDNS